MSDDRKPEPVPSALQNPEDWRLIAEKASKETDPKKLLQLVQHLCDLLDRRDGSARKLPSAEP